MPVVDGWLKPTENEASMLHSPTAPTPSVTLPPAAEHVEPNQSPDYPFLNFPELEQLEMNVMGLPGQPGSMVSVHTESELATYLANTTTAAVKAAETVTKMAGRADFKWDKVSARLVELIATYRQILVKVSEEYLQQALHQFKLGKSQCRGAHLQAPNPQTFAFTLHVHLEHSILTILLCSTYPHYTLLLALVLQCTRFFILITSFSLSLLLTVHPEAKESDVLKTLTRPEKGRTRVMYSLRKNIRLIDEIVLPLPVGVLFQTKNLDQLVGSLTPPAASSSTTPPTRIPTTATSPTTTTSSPSSSPTASPKVSPTRRNTHAQ